MLAANTISIASRSINEGNSGTSLLDVVVVRTGDLNSVVSVGYQTSDGTAVAPSDYTSTSGELTFGVGQSSAAISVPILGDTSGEDNETFQVTLTGVTNTTGAPATLGTATNFAVNANPKGVALADLNGDGLPETIAVNYGSSNFSVLGNTTSPGAGTPSFATKQDFTTQANPLAIATGDINGDGKPDVVISNYNSANISVFLNTTTPGSSTFSFSTAVQFAAANKPTGLTLADINRDSKLDIAVATQGANAVAVLLNTTASGASTPSMATVQTFATPSTPVAMASGDLNGDGASDLIVTNSGADSVSVFLNNTTQGSSTVQWRTRRDFATGASPESVAVGDINGDGRADLVVGNYVGDNVSVLLNQTSVGSATASFAARADFASGNGPQSLALTDFNGDGTLDVLVSHLNGNNVAALINRTARGSGTVTLSAAVNQTVGTQPYSLSVGDLNGDGKPDIVTANLGAASVSAVLNQTTFGSLAPDLVRTAITASTTAHGLASGDLNGDGKADLIAAVPGSNNLGIFVNSAVGGATAPSFDARQDFALGASPITARLVDVNVDGRPDVIVTTATNNVVVLMNTTTPGSNTITFAAGPASFSAGGTLFEITSGDLNLDGRPDLAVSTPSTNNITLLLNNTTPGASSASFTTSVTSATNQPHGITLADVNGDGKLDLIAVNQGTGIAVGSGSTASIRLNLTTPGASSLSFGGKTDVSIGTGARSVVALDVNGDGKPDLVTANRVSNNVTVLLNAIATGSTTLNATSSFTRTDFTAGSEPYAIRTADMNGDGRGDLIVGNRSSTNASVLLNTTTAGSTTPAFGTTFSAGSVASRYLSVADFNLDGRPDLASADASGVGVSVLLNQPTVFGTSAATITILNDDVPNVTSIARSVPSAAATNATNLTYAVTFSQNVTGVDTLDFVLSGDANATINSVSGSGRNWTVTIDVLTQGHVNLNLIDDDTIVDGSGLRLGGTGLNNGNFIDVTQEYTVDLTPPTLTPNISPAANGNGWHNTNVDVTFDPNDALSGVNFATLQGNTTLTNEGSNQTVSGQVRDLAGNLTTATTPTIRIDKTAPTLGFTTNVQPNAAGWFRTDVIYTFTADDNLSGVAVAPGQVTVTGEGNNLTATGNATDVAGNVGTLSVTGIKIDRTAATVTRITSSTANGTYGPGSPVNVTVEFSEPVTLASGNLTLTLNNGGMVVFAPGSINNVSQASGTYTVSPGQATADLNVSSMQLDVGAQLLDRADNPVATTAGAVSIPVGQNLGDNKDLTITSGQAVQFQTAAQLATESNATLQVVVLLTGVAASQITVPLSVSGTATNGSDYTFPGGNVVFPIGASSSIITITLLDDQANPIAEPLETIVFTLGTPNGGVPLGTITQHTVAIQDNELPELAINDVSITEGNAGTQQMTFIVSRVGDLTPAVTFGYTTVNGTATAPSDFAAVTGTGFLDVGQTSTSISITINGDTTVELDETFQVVLTGVNGVIGTEPAWGVVNLAQTGENATAVTQADLNLDGLPDLISADFGVFASSLSIHLGRSTPTPGFNVRQIQSLSATPFSVAAGDLNGDGKPDLVAALRGTGQVAVLLNTTTPGSSVITFAPTQTFTVGTNPTDVAVVDLNRDGRPDVVAVNAGSNNISLLRNTTTLGSSTAAFAATQNFSTQSNPVAIAVADLNSDGIVDLAVANEISNTVSVLFNTTAAGSATFGLTAASNFDVGVGPRDVAIGDLNQDGKPDLVTANRSSASVSWLRNITNLGSVVPAFAAKQDTTIPAAAVAVAVHDVNRDGKPDVAVTSDANDKLYYYTNRTAPGALTLNLASVDTLSVAANQSGVLFGDFDLNGLADFATVSPASNVVSYVFNDTVPTQLAVATTQQSLSASTPVGVVSVDLNGDGLPEAVSANDIPGTLSVFRNTSNPGGSSATFAAAQSFSAGSRPLAVVAADVNGDGKPDLAVTNYNSSTISILLNTTVTGATTFTFDAAQTVSVSASPTDLVFADLNGDGLVDLAVTNRSNNTLSTFINTTTPGSSTIGFGNAVDLATGLGPVGLIAADLNGDGRVDLAVANYTSGDVSLFRNATAPGANTANLAAAQTLTAQTGVQGIAVGDVNRDGRPDLAVAVRSANLVSVLVNNTASGATTFAFDLPQDIPTGVQPNALVFGDLDRDGIVDLVVAHAGDGTLARFINATPQGSGGVGFLAPTTLSVGGSPRDVALADFNYDGIVDLLAANRSGNSVPVLIGRAANLGDASGSGTILDDENTPFVNFANVSQTVGENTTTFNIQVQLSSPAPATVTIPYSVSGGSATGGGVDYSLAASPLVITGGNNQGNIVLTINNDLIDELNETLTIALGAPTGGVLGATSQSTITITDDDPTPTVQFSLTSQTASEAAGTATAFVTLSGPSSQAISVPFTVSGTATTNSDYTISGNSFSLAAGATSASIAITVVNDSTPEANETVVLTLGSPTNAVLGTAVSHSLTILDDESTPQVTLSLQSSPLAESGGVARVIATLSSIATQTVTVNLGFSGSATQTSDYTASAAAITINAGSSTGSITLTGVDDVLAEGPESIVVDVTTVTGGLENGVQQVTASITDDANDPFTLNGNTLSFNGTAGNDAIVVSFSTPTSFTATLNGISGNFTASTINIDGLGGSDTLTSVLSTAADQVTFNGVATTIVSTSYTINLSNVETKFLFGNSADSAVFNDAGNVEILYLLPTHAILVGPTGAYFNEPVGFGSYTGNATGSNDFVFMYGDTGNQNYTASRTQASLVASGTTLTANNYNGVYAYGSGGNDTATYNGAATNESVTSLPAYTFVFTGGSTSYFDSFAQLTINGNGGTDVAVMYDSAGNDTFTANDTSFSFSGTGFNNIASGYDQVYAFQYFGGSDTATLNGSSGNDTLTALQSYSVIATAATLQQATGFSTVIVNAGAGVDTASLYDAVGNDTLTASGSTAELVYAAGNRVRAVGWDTVFAIGTSGGTNRRVVTNPLAFTLTFNGTWV